MPFVGSMGGAYGYGRGQIATEKTVNAVYVQNGQYSQSILDASGNSWLIGGFSGSTASIYNIKGQLVQTITAPNPTTASGNFIAYSSADGFTSVWITLIEGSFDGTSVGSTRVAIDSQNNLIIALSINGYGTTGGQYFKVYNKDTTLKYTLDPCPVYQTFALIKCAPSGTVSWVSTSTNSAGGTYSDVIRIFDVKTDSSDAVVAYIQVSTNTTIQNIQFRTASDVVFGTNIQIGVSSRYSIILRLNSSATSTGSWCGYITGTVTQGIRESYPSLIGHECLQINSQDQIVCIGSYFTGGAVYDASNTQIGPNLLNIYNNAYYTYIIRFEANGSSLVSWRAVLGASVRQDILPAALLVDSSDNIYCVGFCGRYANSYTFYAYNTTNAQVANMNFVATAMENMFIVKYSNAGTPLWVSSIRGTGPVTTSTIFTDGNTLQPASTFCSLDVSGNIYIVTEYKRNSVSLYVGTTQYGSTLTTTVPGTIGDDILIAKILSDNSSGNITKISSTSSSSAGIVPRPILVSNMGDVYVSFRTLKINLGFYSNGTNTSPLVTLANTNGKDMCVVCKYNNVFSSVSVGYVTSTTTTGLGIYINLINFDLSGNIIMTGTHGHTTSSSLVLQVYNFGSTTADLTRRVNTTISRYTYIIKFTLDATPPWIVRTITSSTANLYTTRVIENLIDPTQNNKTYTSGTFASYLQIYDKNNNLITTINSISGNNMFTLFLLNS